MDGWVAKGRIRLGLTGEDGGDEMADAVEEEEFGDDEGFHEHGEAGTDAGEEGNDVHGADDVEDDVAWTSQGLFTFPERHLEKRSLGGGSWSLLLGTNHFDCLARRGDSLLDLLVIGGVLDGILLFAA